MPNISKTLQKELDKLFADMEETGGDMGYQPRKKSSLNRGSVYESHRQRFSPVSNHTFRGGIKSSRFSRYDRFDVTEAIIKILIVISVIVFLVSCCALSSIVVDETSVPTEEKPAVVATTTAPPVDYYPSTNEYETEFAPSW